MVKRWASSGQSRHSCGCCHFKVRFTDIFVIIAVYAVCGFVTAPIRNTARTPEPGHSALYGGSSISAANVSETDEMTLLHEGLLDLSKYTFWSSDFHIGPIADLKEIFASHGITVIDKSLSAHCHLKGTCATDLKVRVKLKATMMTHLMGRNI